MVRIVCLLTHVVVNDCFTHEEAKRDCGCISYRVTAQYDVAALRLSTSCSGGEDVVSSWRCSLTFGAAVRSHTFVVAAGFGRSCSEPAP